MTTLQWIFAPLVAGLVAGGALGWWGGASSGRAARAELAQAHTKARAAEALHQRATTELRTGLQALVHRSTQRAAELERQQVVHANHLAAVLAQRGARLAQLAQAGGTAARKAQALEQKLASASTATQRNELGIALASAQANAKAIATEVAGRTCQATPIPADLLAAWLGETQ